MNFPGAHRRGAMSAIRRRRLHAPHRIESREAADAVWKDLLTLQRWLLALRRRPRSGSTSGEARPTRCPPGSILLRKAPMRARWMNPAASNWKVGTASGAFIEMRSSQSGVRRCLSNRLAIGFHRRLATKRHCDVGWTVRSRVRRRTHGRGTSRS